MKKFLSLLLALTLVLSLVVVPARAADVTTYEIVNKPTISVQPNTSVVEGSELTYTVSTAGLVVNKVVTDNGGTATRTPLNRSEYSFAYSWNNATMQTDNTIAKITSATTGTINNVTCTVTANITGNSSTAPSATSDAAPAVTVRSKAEAFKAAINSITYNERPCTISGDTVTYYALVSEETPTKWNATAPSYNIKSASCDGSKLTIVGTPSGSQDEVQAVFNTVTKANASFTATATPAEVISGGSTVLSTSNPIGFTDAQYTWTYSGNTITSPWTVPAEPGDYTLTCTAKIGNLIAATKNVKVTVVQDKSVLTINKSRIDLTQYGQIDSVVATLKDNGTTISENVKYNFTVVSGSSSTSAIVPTVTRNTASYRLVSTGTLYVKVSAEYKGKTIYVSNNSYDLIVKGALAETTLSSVVNGQYVDLYNTYSYSTLNEAARKALYDAGLVASNATVSSVTLDSRVDAASGSGVPGAVTTITGGYRFTAAAGFIGVARIKGTAKVNATNYTVYFKIPVTPYNIAYEDQYPEPVATTVNGTTYRYAVQVPNGYTSYYVVAKNASVAPSDWSTKIDSATHTSASPYYLYDTDFIGGKCTLYVVTYTSSTTYPYTANVAYCGTITVYQKNYNINYNGVAGETVQFKHTDFTNFMNEVAQARGDSSKTGSYPYVTFSYVTFDYPPTAQGTLYYNGTAMSTSSYSGAFNSRTQITNLDNITFVPYAKTNAKTVAVTFTLHAIKYGTNGTVVNRDVQYRGTVNISLVREDVTFTVAPGDSVTFTDSAFLNYLRAQSGINYNYNIDYVTFDQSAVDTINGGVLYSGYAGFNAVKPTDRFYYTTTNNYTQNALSDVTFRASTYAKTGTTVYIPFTIYARYGTTGTGTRQVTGTVAVKIAQTMNFVDVKPTDYFYNPVKWAVGKNITKGTSAVTFSPDRTCTRAEIVTFLWRDAGSPMPTISRSPFSDVNYSMGADFYNAILWASQNGITAGTDVSHFSPNKTCTRAEIVTFLWRYAKKPVGYGNNSFTDVNKTDHAPYYDAILWAVSKGITNGSTTTTFAPDGTCTRGQAVTFLYRYEGGK